MRAKEIPLIGQDDKRQITLVPPIAADGTMLPCQVIMKGQTERTLPLISIHNISGMEGGGGLSTRTTIGAICKR